MSDPAWLSDGEVAGTSGIVYLQAAGATAAPGTADELGAVLSTSEKHEPQETERSYLNVSSVQSTLSAYKHSIDISVALLAGAQAVRQLLRTAIANKTKVKATIISGPTSTGEKDVYDQAVVSYTRNGDPGEGWTVDITLTGATWTGTAATD